MRRAMSKGHTASRARLIFHPDELRYNFGAEHPLQPSRIAALMHLLETCGLWSPSEEELQRRSQLALKYGFADGDTPVLPGMHEVTAHIAGGSLVALSAVMGLPEGGEFDEASELDGENQRPLHVF